jgi:hypothetical protein
MRNKRPETLRPIYGIALGAIFVLGLIGGVAKIIHDNGRAPSENPLAAKQGTDGSDRCLL